MADSLIPKTFHRIWLDEEVPQRFEDYWSRFQELHPDWKFVTWQDSSELKWMKNHERFLHARSWAGKADIARYEILARHGGVYVDTDVEPLRAFDDLLGREPFIAWEDDKLLCPTVIGSPKGHPAMVELVDALGPWFDERKDAPPNEASGPYFITEQWRYRDDVRRLAPIYFYPVGWWEREELGGPYPKKSYSVHHWVKGWADVVGEAPLAIDISDLKVVIVCPWRPGDQHREDAWRAVRGHLEKLGWPIVTGDSVGVWNRSEAINNAVASIKDPWDAIAIIDTDTIDDPEALVSAVRLACDNSSVVVPWNIRHKLSLAGTQSWMTTGNYSVRNQLDKNDKTPAKATPENRGGAVVVSRVAWDAIGRFDPKFVGWGHEDVAFRIAASVLAPGGLQEVRSKCIHLWHPSAKATATSVGKALHSEYLAARRSKKLMRDLIDRPEPEDPTVSILIPFRDDGTRKVGCDWVVKKWKSILPDAQVVLSSDNGDEPFSKTQAVNNAFLKSTGDILIISDADSFLDDEQLVYQAIQEAQYSHRMVVPWSTMIRLNEEDTKAVMRGDKITDDVRERTETTSPSNTTAGALCVISRENFERVNGMDERFRGWGYEDISFRRSCDALLGKSKYLKGFVYCLHHPRPKSRAGRVWGDNDPGGLNTALNMLYIKAEKRSWLMQHLCDQHPIGGPPQAASLPNPNRSRGGRSDRTVVISRNQRYRKREPLG